MLVISHIWHRCRVNGEEGGEEEEEEEAASVYNGYHGHRYPEISADNTEITWCKYKREPFAFLNGSASRILVLLSQMSGKEAF